MLCVDYTALWYNWALCWSYSTVV